MAIYSQVLSYITVLKLLSFYGQYNPVDLLYFCKFMCISNNIFPSFSNLERS